MNYKLHKYPNGFRTLLIPDKKSPSVTILILVGVGSRYETSTNAGISHFVEHTLFKGSSKYKNSKDLAMAMELLGGISNAFTSYDYTGFYIKVAKANAEKAFAILADLFTKPTFPGSEIEKEKGVVIEEIRMYNDQPHEKIAHTFTKMIFSGNQLAEDIAGNEKTVQAFTVDQLADFTKKCYLTGNTILSVAGDIGEVALEKYVNRYFELPTADIPTFESFDAPTNIDQVHTVNQMTEQAHIVMGGYALPRGHEREFAMKVGNSILSYGFGSMLFQNIREKLALAYYVYSGISQFKETARYSIHAGVEKNKVQLAVQEIRNTLMDLCEGNFSEQDLLRAKNYLIGNIVNEVETSEDLARWYGMQQLLRDETLTPGEYIDRVSSVKYSDVLETWQSMFSDSQMLITILGPEKKYNIVSK